MRFVREGRIPYTRAPYMVELIELHIEQLVVPSGIKNLECGSARTDAEAQAAQPHMYGMPCRKAR